LRSIQQGLSANGHSGEDARLADADLLAAIAQAQPEALAALYDRYRRLVFSVALAIVADPAAAEEVTLDVFVRAWRSAASYRPDQARVSTWLVRIARNHAIDTWRRRKARPADFGPNPLAALAANSSPAADPQEAVEVSQRQARVRAAMGQLTHDQRQALELAYFRGYTQRQIAHALQQPLGTVKTRIRLALLKLRDLLRDEQPPRPTSAAAPPAYNVRESVESKAE
jgi:RNA polymerase sigma-70 factor (ECF subfamily)